MRRPVICFLFFFLLAPASHSTEITKEFFFPTVEIHFDGQYHKVSAPGMEILTKPGFPQLPYQPFNLVIPMGEVIGDIQIYETEWVPAEKEIYPKPGSRVYPISQPVEEETVLEAEIYLQENFYPEHIIDGIHTDFYRGHGIGRFTIHPVRWNPSTGELEQLKHLALSIETTPDEKAQSSLVFLRNDHQTIQDIESWTDEYDYLASYPTSSLDELDELDELETKMIIISAPQHQEVWQTYADFKNRFGLKTEILTTDDIYGSYTGLDEADKIRNALIDYYTSGLEYVLLGGDVQFVPYRLLFAQGFEFLSDFCPADVYFAGLDGNWNTDADTIWGEPGEDDPYQELSIGRASISSVMEAQNWINKQISYQTTPVDGDMNKALMVGEYLGWNVSGSDFKEEVHHGSSNYGYTTAGFPNTWDVATLYDSDYSWPDTDLFFNLNNGVHYINHMGHCSVTYAMRIDSTEVNNTLLTNNGINHNFYMVYSQGCLCGAFEQNSVMEQWNNMANGAFAIIANSRSGWGSVDDTNGPSQRYDREFFDAIFEENIYRIGDVNRDSKHDNISLIEETGMRYCFYELNLFGDPSLELYTDNPGQLNIDLPSSYFLESDSLVFSWNTGVPFHVAVNMDNRLIAIADSDINGNAVLYLEEVEEGNLDVVITAHNYVPIEVVIPAIHDSGAFPIVSSLIVDDNQSDDLENGWADYGETLRLGIEIKNVGLNVTENLDVQVFSESGYVETDSRLFHIDPLEHDESDTIYVTTYINIKTPDLHNAPLRVEMINGSEEWSFPTTLIVHAPEVTFDLVYVDDDPEYNFRNRLEPGEGGDIVVKFRNTGTSPLLGALFTVHENSDEIEITSNQQFYITIPVDSTIVVNTDYQIQVSSTCPDPFKTSLSTQLSLDETDYILSRTSYIDIGGIFNNFEFGDDWTHYTMNDEADQWHIESARNITPYGAYSLKAGGEGNQNYDENTDGCFEFPVYEFDGDVVLSFCHRMDVQSNFESTEYAYDGGWIEISEDGTNWQPFDMPGYNFLSDSDYPIGAESGVYSGRFVWTQESITLSSDLSPLHLRYRFYSNHILCWEGWYIDDLSISSPWGNVPPVNLSGELADESYSLYWEMPSDLPEENLPTGYHVYREEELISDLVSQNVFTDDLTELPPGEYTYTVTAVYENGESEPSQPHTLSWGLSAVETEKGLPSDWAVYPPYPNPFNPSFTVKVDLKNYAPVHAQLYNVLGKRVSEIKTKPLSAGSHLFNFNNSNYSSGIYFLVVKAGPEVKTFKVVMIK